MLELNKIHCLDATEGLKRLPEESIDCVVTSPPYWSLRDYGVAGQIGMEPTFEEYVLKLAGVFDEIWRVLKPTGTIWVNLGDTYWSAKGSCRNPGGGPRSIEASKKGSGAYPLHRGNRSDIPELAPKSLCQIPARLAIEMCRRGWILRNELIWWKPNCVPTSTKDRFTLDFEKIFFFTRSRKYFFEQQLEGHKRGTAQAERDYRRMMAGRAVFSGKWASSSIPGPQRAFIAGGAQGRNKRCVWRIPTQSFPGAHFAVFPEKLIETPIRAGCPEEVCSKCGRPVVQDRSAAASKGLSRAGEATASKDCGCRAGFKPGVVLDPFCGTGTACLVARKLGRSFIGIELNKRYCQMARRRVESVPGAPSGLAGQTVTTYPKPLSP